MPDFAIRHAERSDCERLVALMRELAVYEKLDHVFVTGPGDLEKWLFDDPVASALVACEKDSIVGYAVYFRSFSTFLGKPGLWLEDLFVQPSHRRGGIGKALLRSLAAEAVEMGFGRVEWSVLDWNQSAIDFYNGLGAQILDEWRVCRLSGDRLTAFSAQTASAANPGF